MDQDPDADSQLDGMGQYARAVQGFRSRLPQPSANQRELLEGMQILSKVQ